MEKLWYFVVGLCLAVVFILLMEKFYWKKRGFKKDWSPNNYGDDDFFQDGNDDWQKNTEHTSTVNDCELSEKNTGDEIKPTAQQKESNNPTVVEIENLWKRWNFLTGERILTDKELCDIIYFNFSVTERENLLNLYSRAFDEIFDAVKKGKTGKLELAEQRTASRIECLLKCL